MNLHQKNQTLLHNHKKEKQLKKGLAKANKKRFDASLKNDLDAIAFQEWMNRLPYKMASGKPLFLHATECAVHSAKRGTKS